jgi:GntR family transcriptional regulator
MAQHLPPLRDPRPLYIQAEEALTRMVAESEPGDQLPPEPELAQQLGVSRSTLREALRVLRDKGFIVRKQGVGTFVQALPLVIPSGLESLESLDALAARIGLPVHTDQVTINEREVGDDADLQQQLELEADDKVTCVCRVKRTGKRPVAYIEDMVPVTVAQADELEVGFRDSVLDYLHDRGNPYPDHARADIRALLADDNLASKLALEPGSALLLLEETLYSTDGKPIDYSRNYFVPGFFNFHVIRRIDNE